MVWTWIVINVVCLLIVTFLFSNELIKKHRRNKFMLLLASAMVVNFYAILIHFSEVS